MGVVDGSTPVDLCDAASAGDAGSRRIEGGGTSEASWQNWPALPAVRCLSLNEWLPHGVRLVVVAPHPDDEVLACGGLLAAHAARGGVGLVVAVTDGEASHAGDAAWPPNLLARQRRAESAQGLEALGLRREGMVRFGVPDGRVRLHAPQLVSGLHLALQRTDVVVSTWRLDGHPDHDATGVAVAGVCARIGCRFMEAPVWMWHWARPGDPRVPWHRLMAFELDAAALAAKTAALALHGSQLAARGGAETEPVLGPEILARAARRTEFFFV
ncbi:MAG: hypothetical protein JWP29_359 [Rhodoferax sp.]|nr:hypothetical protein [Rhodoferax sp.]